jgi:hypothetical protein
MHGIRTLILRIFSYREIASWSKFGGVLLQHGEEKSAKSLLVVNIYILWARIKTSTWTKICRHQAANFCNQKNLFYIESPF